MAKKKALAADPGGSAAPLPAIVCPACKSKVSCDGSILHEKSGYLDELIETDMAIDEVEKKLEKQQKMIAGHEATIADLRAQLSNTVKQIDAAIAEKEKEKPNVVPEKQKRGIGSWFD